MVVFNTLSNLQAKSDPGVSRTICWALGTLLEGDSEMLGAWENSLENPALAPEVFGELHDRGVVSIRFCVGDVAGAEAKFVNTFRHAGLLPSVEASLARLAPQAAPRHRATLVTNLRATAEAGSLDAAGAELAKLQASEPGKKCAAIVRQWGEALAGFEPLFDLDASLRERISSADRTAAKLNEKLNREIQRHGPFSDSAAAFDFVVAWLAKAERGLDRDRAVQSSAKRSSRRFSQSRPSATGASGVPTLV
ncbi:hypothetical protein OSTOST_09483 [Ostertagia ostertagi]